MITWWQHLPEHIHPIAFTVGFFSVHWYALFWLLAFLSVLLFTLWLARREGNPKTNEDIVDLYLTLFFGALLGGRLGYVFFYQPLFFFSHPERLFWLYDNGVYIGISGMSFHGGVIGVCLALLFFTRKKKWSFWMVADTVVFSVPLALFFGRLGNFFNQELVGRVTIHPLGMYFQEHMGEGSLRHPSSLYEAFFEGCFLWLLLLMVRHRMRVPGLLSAFFLVSYGFIRFAIEYLREPDFGVALFQGILTRGQVLSFFTILFGMGIFWWLRTKNYGRMRG